jgi:hypothetical protein
MLRAYSPVEQDFVWIAEYSDGTHLAEYDFKTQQPNKFYAIDRDRVIRFGLAGHGMRLFYEVFGGIFKLNGQMVEFVYKEGDKSYSLTGQPMMYSDIITYKDAESTAIAGGRIDNRITQFNFGYKAKLQLHGVNFQVKVVCSIPFNKPAYLNIRLVADQDLNGKFIVRTNGLINEEFTAPLSENVGGELNWVIR